LWSKVVPDLTGDPYYPTMSWLAVDGYGFDRAYFDTGRWVDAQQLPKPYAWEGSPDYFLRAVDQGIGRALWFICGARTDDVAASVARFAGHRRADLWSGVGLAATFAGGSDAEGLAGLARAAGEHAGQLAMGVVLATKARDYAGFVPDHSALATRVLAGCGVEAAVALADDGAVRSGDGRVPAYELWRQNIAAHFGEAAAAA
jgi:hypothetical protein